MRDIFVEETRDIPTTWRSPGKSRSPSLKSDPSSFDINQSIEYWQGCRALAGSPFESSDSDSSSDCDDDTMSLGSSDPFYNDVALISEGLKTLDIIETNALGLVFIEEEVLATEAVATLTQQAEGLRAPRYHQDDRSCGRPNQKCYAQQEYVPFQSDGPTDETLVRGFPQDIGLWADVSDTSGPKVFQGSACGSPFDEAHGGGCDQPVTPRKKKIIPLPEEQEYDEDLLYGGPDLGGWLSGTLDGIPKAMLGGLSCLDIPMPFAMEDWSAVVYASEDAVM